jgi:hypothetical protein
MCNELEYFPPKKDISSYIIYHTVNVRNTTDNSSQCININSTGYGTRYRDHLLALPGTVQLLRYDTVVLP